MMMIDTYLKVGYMMIKINTNLKEMYMFYSGICGNVSYFSEDTYILKSMVSMVLLKTKFKRCVLL